MQNKREGILTALGVEYNAVRAHLSGTRARGSRDV